LDISNDFVVPLAPEETWKVLLDIERIMPCVPGAELLEVMEAQTYKGKVSVNLGPVALSFVGTAKFEELDEAAKKAKVLAKGSDSKGRGGANAVVQFRLEPVDDGTKVIVETNVNLSGSVAQYGRGTGVIQAVAGQLTAQFAQNLKAMLAYDPSSEPEIELPPMPEPVPVAPVSAAPEAPAAPAATAPEAAPPAPGGGMAAAVPAFATEAVAAATARIEAAGARSEAAAARVEAAVARTEAATAATLKAASALRPPPPPMPQSKPISGFSLMLTVLWGMVTGIFSGKKGA
jgi:carbon monoxide dehydrogenase subunit G